MPSLFDVQFKQKYALIYFKRNFWRVVRDAYRWNLDENDINLLKEAWKLKAHTHGSPGLQRWKEIEEEWETKTKPLKKLRGQAWQTGEEPYNYQKKRPYQ